MIRECAVRGRVKTAGGGFSLLFEGVIPTYMILGSKNCLCLCKFGLSYVSVVRCPPHVATNVKKTRTKNSNIALFSCIWSLSG